MKGAETNMHGVVIPVSAQKLWNFTYLPATTGSEERIYVARGISVVPFKSLALFVRVHANSIPGTGGQKIEVVVANVYPSGDDPTIFTESGATLMTAVIDGTKNAGDVVVAEPTAGALVAPWVLVQVVGTQDVATQNPVAASLSVGLLGRVN